MSLIQWAHKILPILLLNKLVSSLFLTPMLLFNNYKTMHNNLLILTFFHLIRIINVKINYLPTNRSQWTRLQFNKQYLSKKEVFILIQLIRQRILLLNLPILKKAAHIKIIKIKQFKKKSQYKIQKKKKSMMIIVKVTLIWLMINITIQWILIKYLLLFLTLYLQIMILIWLL